LPPVGNDIVDLKEPENCGKSGDERFIRRVFTPEERDRIVGAACPDQLLWAFWAAKEAAYKAVSRDDSSICSTPRRYSVVLDDGSAYYPFNDDGDSTGGSPLDRQKTGKDSEDPEEQKGRLVGRVITPGGAAALWIMVTKEYVHALATTGGSDLGTLIQRVDRVDAGEAGGPSAFVRGKLLHEIALRLKCPIDDLVIRKEPLDRGAPCAFLRGRPLAAEISLSHDGRFTAFALRLPR
jgi:hypothetical protein